MSGNIKKISGKYFENIQKMAGKCLEDVWKISGKHLENLPNPQENARPAMKRYDIPNTYNADLVSCYITKTSYSYYHTAPQET